MSEEYPLTSCKEVIEEQVRFLQEFSDSLVNAVFLVNLNLDAEPDERFRGMIFQKGAVVGQQPLINIGAPDLDTLLARAQEAYEARKAMLQEVRVATMALFIMRKTKEQGYITRNDLIEGHFSEAEIDALSQKALDDAQELASPGTFKIS